MSNRVPFSTASPAALRSWPKVLGILLFWSPSIVVGKSYLDAIQTEAAKLDGGNATEPAETADSTNDDPRNAFEQELEQRYRGTYLLYKKLPAKSQEEVFLEYREGTPIEGVRKTIMNRFLHSR